MSADQPAALECRGLSVDYGDVPALRDLDLDVARGEIVALLGPSGSGKSTLLQAIAGLVHPSDGEIWLAGRRVASADANERPDRRDVGMVFQNYALWPHLNVVDTVAYPMRRAGHRRSQARAAAAGLLELLGLSSLAHRRPAELSGGEQQRVGLARALARNAGLYLLDEPTAHLDTHLRAAFQGEVRARQRESGAAVVYATHDAAEALALADRVALISRGRLLQVGRPWQVYAEPVDVTAARLTGPASVIAARVGLLGDGLLSIEIGDAATTATGTGPATPDVLDHELLLRPEWTRRSGPFTGRIDAIWFRGPHTDYEVSSPAGTVLVREPGPPRHTAGEPMSWGIERACVLPGGAAEYQPNAAVAPG
jgi:iron(III) transport system ATP-binding protein